MERYINPENIKLNSLSWIDGGEDILVPLVDVKKAIAQTPTEEDVVKIVRCKNCVHWGGINYGFVCRKLSGIDTKICMGAEHYCSYGERKENESSID